MTKIDQFESVFKAATKIRFQLQPIPIGRILVVTDLDGDGGQRFASGIRRLLGSLDDDVVVSVATADQTRDTGQMLEQIEAEAPDLVCTYRNLHTRAWRWKHSLGDRLDVLTQAIATPVLVLPHPDEHGESEAIAGPAKQVGVLTDHLVGDGRLVSWGVRLSTPGGQLFLTHVEDRATFERYLEVIGKIPEIDTDTARQEILNQLLKEPRDFIASCAEVLAAAAPQVEVVPVVTLGSRLSEHIRLVTEEGLDLLVMNTKDQDQFAMHGLAYPLAVELRHVPLLML